MTRYFSSLRARLTVLVLLAIVPALLFVLYTGLRQRQLEGEKVEDQALSLARDTAADQRRLIEAARQLLMAIAQVPAVRQGPSAVCSQFLADEWRLHSVAYVSFNLADPQGIVQSSSHPSMETNTVADRLWFREAVRGREFVVGSFESSGPGGKPGLTVAHPLLKRDSKPSGVLFATLDLRWMNQAVTEEDLPPGATLTMVDNQGMVLARYPQGEQWLGAKAIGVPVVRTILEQRAAGTLREQGLDGEMRLHGFAPIRMAGRTTDAWVIVGVPLTAAYAQANRNLFQNVGLLLGVAVLALVAIHFGGDSLLVRPLTALVDVTRRLAAGDLQARTGAPYGKGELEELRRSFDEMAAALENQAMQLRRSNRALRTISECNQALVRAQDETGLYQEVCRIIVEHGGYRMAWAGLAGHDPKRLVHPVAQAGFDNGYLQSINVTWADSEDGRGTTGTAIRTGQPSIVRDVKTDPRFAPWREAALARGYVAVLGLPLTTETQVWGALTIYAGELGAFDEAEVALLGELAADVAYGVAALRNRVERERAERQLQESEQRFRSIVESSPMGMHFYALQPDGRLTFTGGNRAADIILGLDHSELVGKPVEEAFPGLVGTEVPARYREACLQGTPWRTEHLDYADGAIRGAFEVHTFQTGPGRIAVLFFEITERRRAQTALEASERRFRELFEASPDAIFVEDLDGNVVDVNPAGCRLHGLNREHLIGRNVRDLIPPEQRDTVNRDFPKLARGELTETEGFSFTAGGKAVPVEIKAGHIDFNGRPALLLHVRDITTRQQAERTLRESEHRYRAVIEQSADGIYMVDITSKRVVESNPAFRQMLGYPADATLDISVHDIIADQPSNVDARLNGIAHEGQPITSERRYRRRDGALLDVLISASRIRYGGRDLVCTIVRDITERKRAEEARVRLATAVEQAVEGIMITDANGTIQYVNPAIELMTGYQREELIGRNPRILKSGKQDVEYYRDMWQILTRGEVWRGFFFNRKKDGSVYQEESMISPIRDANGRITSYVAVKRDVTREIAIEIQLLQSQKMEAIGRLAGGLAHDFNNVLTAITGYSELSLKRITADDPLRHNFDEIIKAADRAASLTRQLLAFSRKQVLEPKIVDLNALTANFQQMLRRLIGEDIELSAELAPGLWSVKADPGQLEQVVMNMAINARDAMPLGGKLALRTTNISFTEPHTITNAVIKPGDYVRLSVQDTGVGMSEEIKAHLFEPFFTTKPAEKGTGLGLATCYGIISQSGGYIEVETAPGRGSSFHIYLPRLMDVTPLATTARPANDDGSRGTETILLVEDEEAVRELSTLVLTDLGYQLHTASNGVEALKLLVEAGQPHLDLLLTDVVMPQMGGRELAERLRETMPDLKILFCSGYTAESEWVSRALTKDTHFLQKPFTGTALAQKVREVLAS